MQLAYRQAWWTTWRELWGVGRKKKRAEWRLIVTFAPLTKRIAAAECLNLGGWTCTCLHTTQPMVSQSIRTLSWHRQWDWNHIYTEHSMFECEVLQLWFLLSVCMWISCYDCILLDWDASVSVASATFMDTTCMWCIKHDRQFSNIFMNVMQIHNRH